MTSEKKKGGAMKSDEGKLPVGLVPFELIEAVASVMKYGAKKYTPWDFAKGYVYSRAWEAVQRHLWAWWSGESNDPETSFSHLWHAAAALAILIFFEKRGMTELDDRPPIKEFVKRSGSDV